MAPYRCAALAVPLLLSCVAGARADEETWNVLPETSPNGPWHDMMRRCLQGQVDAAHAQWIADYEARTSSDAIAAYQADVRGRFVETLGGFPERTPLNARTTGVIEREGYRVEKVVFESRPNHHVTALLFLPESDAIAPPWPGVLVPCGHSQNGKGHDTYQSLGALLAIHGMAALVFDPIDQGERSQTPDLWPDFWGTRAHMAIGVGSILLGTSTAQYEIWDGMRAIDYLQSLPEIDPERIGCSGNSGGGTQTAFLMALDDRIKAAAPSCYIHGYATQLLSDHSERMGDAEQNHFAQLAFGMDHADYLMLRAPTPILVVCATHDFFRIEATWESYHYAKRLYARLGFAERLDIIENDAPHNFDRPSREAVVRWMARWLQGRDEPLTEPPITLLTEDEFRCTADGHVMHLEGERATYDLNGDRETECAAARAKLWANETPAAMLQRVRAIAAVRRLGEIPKPRVELLGEDREDGLTVRKLILTPEEGVVLPAVLLRATEPVGRPVLCVDEGGKAASLAADGPAQLLAAEGRAVLCVDLRGMGETRQTEQDKFGPNFGADWQDVFTAYILGRSYVGMRAEDVLVAARWLSSEEAGGGPVDLDATGGAGIPALHAAALEPELFGSVTLRRTLAAWSLAIAEPLARNQLVNAVHGALEVYDLPDLARTVGERLRIEDPVDARGDALDDVTPGTEG